MQGEELALLLLRHLEVKQVLGELEHHEENEEMELEKGKSSQKDFDQENG